MDLDKGAITEPPILAHVAADELQILTDQKDTPPVDLKRFPCHTHAVERTLNAATSSRWVLGIKKKNTSEKQVFEIKNTHSLWKI